MRPHNFIDCVTDECTRRSTSSDNEKVSILKSCISFDDSSLSGLVVRTYKLASFTSFDAFTSELRIHFQSNFKLGDTHSLLKLPSSITQYALSLPNPFQAENIASSHNSELINQLQASNCFF